VDGQQRVGPLTELPQVLRELGADPGRLIAQTGIEPDLLRNPENVLSLVAVGRLMQICVEATGCQHLGLLVGQRSACSSLGLVGRLMQNAPTLGEAMLDLCANQHRYIHGAVTYFVMQDRSAFWGYAIHLPGVQGLEQISDCATAIGFNMVRELAGVSPSEVLISRGAPIVDTAPYHRFFGSVPQFNAEQHALVFPERLLAAPVPRADAKLRAILEKSVADYWAIRQPRIADHVTRILRARVIFPDVSLEDVASSLRLQPRTLNRRLEAEGTSFRRLLNEVRFEVACQLLAGTRIQVTNVALALGYADLSGFTHAFQRWSGKTPSEWREWPG
jgi:AraC-like DNA-binding protein